MEPLVSGKPLIPSAAIDDWYDKQLKTFIDAMSDDYKSEISALMETPSVERHYARDASLPMGRFERLFERLYKKWAGRLSTFMEKTSRTCAVKVDQHSFTTVSSSLKAIGMKEPKDIKKSEWETQMGLYVNENIALIKSITQEFHSGIEKATWNSLTSKEGTEQGAYGISNYIYEHTKATKKRAEFIAMDQTKKLYSVLNNARMEQNGLDRFQWMHSSAGKTPRQCHIDWNGRYFLTKGGPAELYEIKEDGKIIEVTVGYDGCRKADIGKPGYPINCRCRARPVLDV